VALPGALAVLEARKVDRECGLDLGVRGQRSLDRGR